MYLFYSFLEVFPLFYTDPYQRYHRFCTKTEKQSRKLYYDLPSPLSEMSDLDLGSPSRFAPDSTN